MRLQRWDSRSFQSRPPCLADTLANAGQGGKVRQVADKSSAEWKSGWYKLVIVDDRAGIGG